MKNKFLKITFVIFSILGLAGCYPGGYETYEESDIVVTNYNPDFDFQSVKTYFMPDTIQYIEDDEPVRTWDSFITNELAKQFAILGYEREMEYDESNPPDIFVSVAVLTVDNVDIYSYPYYGYPYYGYGWGWYGYPYYGGYPVVVTYTTGTLNWKMFSPENVKPEEDIIPIEYSAAVNGLVGSSLVSAESRIVNAISKAFQQSPYLK
jgi:hypothetical protein